MKTETEIKLLAALKATLASLDELAKKLSAIKDHLPDNAWVQNAASFDVEAVGVQTEEAILIAEAEREKNRELKLTSAEE